jgi:serine/threonine protein kinase
MMELADDMDSGGESIPRCTDRGLSKTSSRQTGNAEGFRRGCVEIAIKLVRGLQILHESGFTHRDVRPSNIIFVNDVPKLADIDLLAGNDAALASYIPRNYAAPEGSHSNLADIFSLGKTLYEMCTGLPVQAYPSLPPDVRYWHDHQLLLKLNKIMARACARDLRKRYNSAQMLNALECID